MEPKRPPETGLCVKVNGCHMSLKKNFWQVCEDPDHPDHEAFTEFLRHLRSSLARESKTTP